MGAVHCWWARRLFAGSMQSMGPRLWPALCWFRTPQAEAAGRGAPVRTTGRCSLTPGEVMLQPLKGAPGAARAPPTPDSSTHPSLHSSMSLSSQTQLSPAGLCCNLPLVVGLVAGKGGGCPDRDKCCLGGFVGRPRNSVSAEVREQLFPGRGEQTLRV